MFDVARKATAIVALGEWKFLASMADNEQIIYANKAVEPMFRSAERDIRKQLPNLCRCIAGQFDRNISQTSPTTSPIVGQFHQHLRQYAVCRRAHHDGGCQSSHLCKRRTSGFRIEWAERTSEVAVERFRSFVSRPTRHRRAKASLHAFPEPDDRAQDGAYDCAYSNNLLGRRRMGGILIDGSCRLPAQSNFRFQYSCWRGLAQAGDQFRT